MSEVIIGEKTEASASFCPSCGSASIEVKTIGILVPGRSAPAYCLACQWSGVESELVRTTFKHEFKSDDEIAQAMMTDLRNLLAKTAAASYGSFLLKWGFLDKPIKSEQLGRYIMEIAQATTRTIIETRKKMEEEAHGSPVQSR